jgi:hypothetical protein
MSEMKFSELDFNTIKDNLKNFLKTQEQFKDYNFEGSSISILLDLLAYNTAYNSFYLNMLSSEMFLDSAYLRDNVLSRAKHLGYLPNSVRSLTAVVDVEYDYSRTQQTMPSGILQLNRDDEVFALVDSKKFYFTVKTPKEVTISESTTKKVTIKSVELIEGRRFKHSYTVQEDTGTKQRFIIPNDNVDISTLNVTVKKSASNSEIISFKRFTDITTLSTTDAVYYIQAYDATQYEVVFGDGILGKKLEVGNVITLDYIVSSGNESVGAKLFKPTLNRIGKVDGSVDLLGMPIVNITCVTPAYGYADVESISSIKLSAPNFYQSQNRTVTKSDFETLLKKEIPGVEYIRVWGGEENDPPYYGKVFCAIKPETGFSLNTYDKVTIIDRYIRPKSILSLDLEIVDPEYIGLVVNTTVNYFPQKTSKTKSEIVELVYSAIKKYRDDNLKGFDSDFRFSKMLKYIDGVDTSIESNDTEIKLKYKITPTINLFYDINIQLNNGIFVGSAQNPSIISTPFFYKGTLAKISDDGNGKLYVYAETSNGNVILNSNLGDIDYSKGKMSIRNLYVTDIPNDLSNIDILIKPAKSDIIAYRNQIINLDNDDIIVNSLDLNTVKLS